MQKFSELATKQKIAFFVLVAGLSLVFILLIELAS